MNAFWDERYENLDDLQGVVVFRDDILVTESYDSQDDAVREHDDNLTQETESCGRNAKTHLQGYKTFGGQLSVVEVL